MVFTQKEAAIIRELFYQISTNEILKDVLLKKWTKDEVNEAWAAFRAIPVFDEKELKEDFNNDRGAAVSFRLQENEEENERREDEFWAATYELREMVLKKYPEAQFRRGRLEEIPEGKYKKVAYIATHGEDQEFIGIVNGFWIAAIDKATEKDAIIYHDISR